ncbi:type-F conjugative transfer system pilin assembly protein TraF [Piscirickettsia salmonis]|uniref:type-F conjugative transfer system pilin assembly protein TraF n=1 Tax=Piscirickettsia salmonis TaxID=1238 RepID=UPI0006BCABC5|nr:type-F conjugative transfer system pilin assembly protein TraF [Piscirickettsia salmonis]ALA26648.1 conjugal transfer protein TraF [Piscirickettsia salmonis]APS45861.1 hypothetical protein AVI48_15625 [Piscirickettsia salmonis]APS49256.1 hypothetical protein AVI49_16500 [Piscirickettsia salmonis]QGO82357.1 conjugal pilus assembly protein TraF [Piscirickettsia salmonis]QGP24186.1 conjugal pilus assembly protein TraF [Piscirickettsia salmonis]
MKLLIAMVCLFLPWFAWANFNDEDPQGFHWYTHNQEQTDRVKRLTQSQAAPVQETVTTMQPYQQLQYLSLQTKNTLSTALMHPSVKNTTRYMYAQQFWAKQDQKFVRSWQQALLQHPDLDYRLNFPTDNNAIPVRNDEKKALVEKVLQSTSKHFGLILFYQGHSSICQKFASILMPFVQQYHFSMISVTTDNQPIVGLPNPKSLPMASVAQVMHLKPRYLPALFLVRLKTHQIQALSYGFISTDDLKERFLDVLNNFQRYSYHGIGETHQ